MAEKMYPDMPQDQPVVGQEGGGPPPYQPQLPPPQGQPGMVMNQMPIFNEMPVEMDCPQCQVLFYSNYCAHEKPIFR